MRGWLNTIIVGAGILIAAFLATPTLAIEPIQVTRGNIFPFAAGQETGYNISGRATMVRSAAGHTTMTLRVQGLMPNTSYGVNVHNLACSNQAGGGHYQHEVGGTVDNINEMWQVMTTRTNGYGYSKIANDFVARSEARSVIIHNADNTSLACANLSPINVSPYTLGTTQIEELASLSAAMADNPSNSVYYADNPELMASHRFVVADGSATTQYVDIEVLRQRIFSDWGIEAEAVDVSILRHPAQGNVTGQPISVDIEVLRQRIFSDWGIEAEAVDVNILKQPIQGNVTSQPAILNPGTGNVSGQPATFNPGTYDKEELRQHIFSDWGIEAEAVEEIGILGQPTQGNVTGQPVVYVDIEVLRNNYYNIQTAKHGDSFPGH